MCFILKEDKMLPKSSKGIQWLSMYSSVNNVGLWRASLFWYFFYFLVSPAELRCLLQTQTCSCFCFSYVGAEVFAFPLSVPCVNLRLYEFRFVLLLHWTCWMVDRETDAESNWKKTSEKRQKKHLHGVE